MIARTEISAPDLTISLVVIAPVAYAMALGGVEMGRAKANEQERARVRVRRMLFGKGKLGVIGRRMLAAAVLLIKVDKTTERTANSAMRLRPVVEKKG